MWLLLGRVWLMTRGANSMMMSALSFLSFCS